MKNLLGLYAGRDIQLSDQWNSFVLSRMKANRDESENYWREYLADIPPCEPTQIGIAPASKISAGEVFREISDDIMEGLTSVARANNVTVATIFLAIFRDLLGRYSNQTCPIIGVTTSGRAALEEADAAVGVFINTLPFSEPEGRDFIEGLGDLQARQIDHETHGWLGLSSIRSLSSILLNFLLVATLGSGNPFLVNSDIIILVFGPETLITEIPANPGPEDRAYIVIKIIIASIKPKYKNFL